MIKTRNKWIKRKRHFDPSGKIKLLINLKVFSFLVSEIIIQKINQRFFSRFILIIREINFIFFIKTT